VSGQVSIQGIVPFCSVFWGALFFHLYYRIFLEDIFRGGTGQAIAFFSYDYDTMFNAKRNFRGAWHFSVMMNGVVCGKEISSNSIRGARARSDSEVERVEVEVDVGNARELIAQMCLPV